MSFSNFRTASRAGLASLTGSTFTGDVFTSRLGAGSAAAFSTVEKFRVNTPVTPSTAASAMIAAGTNAAIPLVIQGAAGQSVDYFEVQNSAGAGLMYLNSAGLLVQTGALYLGAGAASAGQIRLPNNTAINWRNAGNTADVGITLNASNALALTDGLHLSVGTTTGTQIATATTQKIGFWAKTPIVQPTTAYAAGTFVANAGTAINDASTIDGYTLKQVVAALRGVGILA